MGNLGLSELLVIAVVALLVIGPKRLPEVARGLGQALRSFQDAMNPVRSVKRKAGSEDEPNSGGSPATPFDPTDRTGGKGHQRGGADPGVWGPGGGGGGPP